MIPQKDPPGKRSSYSGFHYWNGKYYLYAGLGSGRWGDLHELDLSRKTWKKIEFNKNGRVNNNGNGKGKNMKIVPLPRGRHSVVLYNGFLVSYGGWVNSSRSDELWVFSLETRKWKFIGNAGMGPGKLEAHCAVILGNGMYVFGGWRKEGKTLNSLYSINLEQITGGF